MHSSAVTDQEAREIRAARIQEADALHPTWLWGLLPAIAAVTYPYALKLFHACAGGASVGTMPSPVGAAASLIWIIAVPFVGLFFAYKLPGITQMRRLAYAAVMVPPFYVLIGVIQLDLRSPVSDELLWWTLWTVLSVMAVSASQADTDRHNVVASAPRRDIRIWRYIHGGSALVLLLYILFHLANHLAGLWGPDAWKRMADIGRTVYRAPIVEPILITLFLGQVISGIRLMWRWGTIQTDFHRVFQVASGTYISVFLLSHLNSVFLYARTHLGITTGWDFAVGAPTGIIHGAWNIRLLPHYLLAVFFVLSHIASGARSVALDRGWSRARVDSAWLATNVLAGGIAITIIAAMVGARI